MPRRTDFINGGIASIDDARAHLAHVDGVMLGRAAYKEPWRLLSVDPDIFGDRRRCRPCKMRSAMMPYIERQLARGTRLHSITRHFVGAFHAVPGARAFRRHLAENGTRPGADVRVLEDAISKISERQAA